MKDILFSIIIPIYNTHDFLDKAINSVIKQKFEHMEILCIDDGSTDNSAELLEDWKKRDLRIKLITQDNAGASAARNLGFQLAMGKYIMFLDSDDYLHDEAVREIYDAMEKGNLDICYFDSLACGEDLAMINSYRGIRKKIYDGVYRGKYLIQKFDKEDMHNVVPWGGAYRRSFLINNKLFFKEGIILEDNLFYLQTLMKANRVAVINKVLYFYYRRKDSVMGKRNYIKQYISMAIILEEMNVFFRENNITFEEQLSISNFLTAAYRNIRNLSKMIVERNMECVLIDEVERKYDKGNMWFLAWLLDDTYFRIKNKNVILELHKYDNILIYGAGKVGKRVAEWLSDNGIDNFRFVATEINDNSYCLGNKVEAIEKIAKEIKSGIVLIAVGPKYRDEILESVKKFSNLKYICLS